MFVDNNFEGASRELTSDAASLSDFNDKISSLKVEKI
ncbi:hypothetical protein [Streptomyces xanthophaeus]